MSEERNKVVEWSDGTRELHFIEKELDTPNLEFHWLNLTGTQLYVGFESVKGEPGSCAYLSRERAELLHKFLADCLALPPPVDF